MLQWVQESWIAVIIGFLFIGILLDAVIASREAIADFIKRLRNKPGGKNVAKGR
ncbi:MAG: hypothetical protein L0212_12640 [Acidobacteria bacterium]|nr:hypothetical protein [Acidobacteriota bacterium]